MDGQLVFSKDISVTIIETMLMSNLTFSENASKRGEFQIVKKMTCPVLLFENVFYSPLFEALF